VEYRNLGRTGVKVSTLCLGTMMFGRSAGERESLEMIAHALDAGVNFIDTANAYANGTSERRPRAPFRGPGPEAHPGSRSGTRSPEP
jgi:aryl-alcohol dehydrogenase-like predicted oxidoreductase